MIAGEQHSFQPKCLNMNTQFKYVLRLFVSILLSALIIVLAYSALFWGFAAVSDNSLSGVVLGLLLVIWVFVPFMLLGCTLLVGWLMPRLDAWIFVLTGTITTICLFSFRASILLQSPGWLLLAILIPLLYLLTHNLNKARDTNLKKEDI